MADVSISVALKSNFKEILSGDIESIRKTIKEYDELSNTLKSAESVRTKIGNQISALESLRKKETAELKTYNDQLKKGKQLDESSIASLQAKKQEISEYIELTKQMNKRMSESFRIEQDLKSQSSKKNILQGNSAKSMLTGFGITEAVSMLGSQASSFASYFAGSFGGSDSSQLVGDIVSGLGSSAMLLAMNPSVTGIALAGVQAVLSTVQAFITQAKNHDEAFTSIVQEQRQIFISKINDALTSGSDTAKTRESSEMSFATILKDDNAAKTFMQDMIQYANVTPYKTSDLQAVSKTLATYNFKGEELMPIMEKIGDAGAAMSMGASDMSMIATALGRMRTTNKTTLEYMNLLTERGINGVEYLAESLGKTTAELYTLISQGKIEGKKSVQVITDYMERDYGGSMEKFSRTYEGLTSTYEGLKENLDATMGTGYNNERSIGLQAQIDFLSGSRGKDLEKAYELVGKFKAEYENTKEKIWQDTYNQIMNSPEWVRARVTNNGAEMMRLLNEAEARALSSFSDTDIAKRMQDTNDKMIKDSQVMFNENWTIIQTSWDSMCYRLEQSLSIGLAGARQEQNTTEEQKKGQAPAPSYGAAYGLSRVPYDGYKATLHDGERVLTASQAREFNRSRGLSGGIHIIVSNMTVRQDNDIEAIAQALYREIQNAAIAYVR
ncbi:MAG: tape measure protein [Christensenella sp.]